MTNDEAVQKAHNDFLKDAFEALVPVQEKHKRVLVVALEITPAGIKPNFASMPAPDKTDLADAKS